MNRVGGLVWPVVLYALLGSEGWAQRVMLSGYVVEQGSEEPLPGANVVVVGSRLGVQTNAYGFWSLPLPLADSTTLLISMLGYRPERRTVSRTTATTLRVALRPQAQQLAEVIVKENGSVTTFGLASGLRLTPQQVRELPALLGEKDIIKVLQLLPGVQKGTEGSAALYVRGGGPDQNLILLDGAPVYNANHLFGFFSVFNSDAVKTIDFYKGGFPAQYGGRVSSVLDIQLKEGNRQRLTGTGGIGLIASRLTLEGPLTRRRNASFVVSGRRTYLDLLVKPFQPKTARTGYYFYDFTAKANFDLTANDKLHLSSYIGQDKFTTYVRTGTRTVTTNQSGLDWGNATTTLRWNRRFSPRLFANTTLLYSQYDFALFDELKRERPTDTQTQFTEYRSAVRDYGFRTDWDYFGPARHVVKAGVWFTAHRFRPRAYSAVSNGAPTTYGQGVIEQTQEGAVYVEDTYRPVIRLRLNAGLRLTYFRNGPLRQLPLEPRLAANYQLGPRWSAKATYARMHQYLHLLSNTGAGLPTDLWVPATAVAPPQQSDQVTVGLARSDVRRGITISAEGYCKQMHGLVNYREGANFLIIGDAGAGQPVRWEANVVTGRGWSYGGELLVQKEVGRLTGWVGYTLSWTRQQFAALNGGRPFFARYDRRHDVSVVTTYRWRRQWLTSVVWVYGTGNALTLPSAAYYAPEHSVERGLISGRRFADYDARNAFRAAPYHRLDVSVQRHRARRWGGRFWEFGLYNAYNRRNPFYYRLETVAGPAGSYTTMRRVSLFPVMPSVSYNVSF